MAVAGNSKKTTLAASYWGMKGGGVWPLFHFLSKYQGFLVLVSFSVEALASILNKEISKQGNS